MPRFCKYDTASVSASSDASFPSVDETCRRNEALFCGRSAPILPNALTTRRSAAGVSRPFEAVDFFGGTTIAAASFFLEVMPIIEGSDYGSTFWQWDVDPSAPKL